MISKTMVNLFILFIIIAIVTAAGVKEAKVIKAEKTKQELILTYCMAYEPCRKEVKK